MQNTLIILPISYINITLHIGFTPNPVNLYYIHLTYDVSSI
nr:MAG TPA_asm: hypothetical protein [Bacteriophage sp.]